MIRNLVARFTLTALAAVACGPSSQPEKKDEASALAEAKARAQDLANSTQNYQPVRFVSAIEQVRPPKPVRQLKPDEVVRKGQDSVMTDPTPLPIVVEQDAPGPIQTDSFAKTASSPRVPSITPRDAPMPDAVGGSGGSGDWRGNDPGPDMGTVIGVVLRGGRVDPGHCPRHPRPPTQIPNRRP